MFEAECLAVNPVGPTWWYSDSAVDIDLANSRLWTPGGGGAWDFASYLSISRASNGYAKSASGTLVPFASNELRRTDLGLLVEDARENLVTYSEDFTQWIPGAGSVTADQATAPNGTLTADKVTSPTSASALRQNASFAVSAGQDYAVSLYVKPAGANTWVGVELSDFVANSVTKTFNLSGAGSIGTTTTAGDGSLSSASIETLAGGWYRCIFICKFTAGHSGVKFCYYGPMPTDGGAESGDCYLWGADTEAASFPSSYIPTTTTSATRAADTVTCVGGLDAVIKSTAMSIVFSSKCPAIDSGGYLGGPPGNGFYQRVTGDATSIQANCFVTALNVLIGNGLHATDNILVGYAQNASGRSVVGAGGTVATDVNLADFSTSTISPALHRRLTAWNFRLPDAVLQARTMP